MQNVINDVKESVELDTDKEIVDEGKKVVQELEKLHEQIKNDAVLESIPILIPCHTIPSISYSTSHLHISSFCPIFSSSSLPQNPFQYKIDIRPLDTEIDPTIQSWNAELASFGPKITYLSGPWLYVECYMYRRIQNILSRTQHWKKYDVFKRQKDSTFKKSKKAICELAHRYRSLVKECQEGLESREVRKLLFVWFPVIPDPPES